MSGTALVIGLDGMPRTLMEQFARDGVLPNIAELLRGGYCAPLRAPVPEISSTSWATFMTGVNPGRHGIYGFSDLRPNSYETYFPSVRDLRAPALWEHAASAGLRTICANVPGTYPAPDIDGVLVSGFVAPRLERAVTPASLLDTLCEFEYELDVEVGAVREDPGAFLGRALRALRARTRAFEHLLVKEPWDLAVTVLTETDRVQHFLWAAVADPGHPLHASILDFYRAVDDAVGVLAAAAGPDCELFLVSDHGFGPAECQFYVNAWLRESGWLAGLDVTPSLDRLDPRSCAFALDPARIYIHRAGRFPKGALTDRDAADVTAQIAEEIAALRRDGDRIGPDVDGPKLAGAVHRASEVYHGHLFTRAPDIVVVPAEGVQLRGAWGGLELVRPDVLTGTHTRGNAVFYRRGAQAPAEPGEADMADVLPTVLAAIGVPVPDLDGTPVLHRVPTMAASSAFTHGSS